MSGRSFARDLAVHAGARPASWLVTFGVASCVAPGAGCSTQHKPEADPARLVSLMKAMDKHTPTPGAAPACKPEQLVGGATLTQVTLLKIAKEPANPGPEREDWINPAELDSPAARELIDPNADETTQRQAAYELLSAPFFLVYRIDIVDAPMALGVKDLKRGTVDARALRYDVRGNIVCAKVVTVQNSRDKSDWAILQSNLTVIDPKVAAALRDDLRTELFKHIRALGRPD
jgi:hypothetical protein